jgi:hypothetical protein
MRLRPDFVAHDAGGEWVLVPVGGASFSGIVRGNRTLGDILTMLQDDTSEEEIVSSLRKRYDAPEGAIERDVARALDELRGIGAIGD